MTISMDSGDYFYGQWRLFLWTVVTFLWAVVTILWAVVTISMDNGDYFYGQWRLFLWEAAHEKLRKGEVDTTLRTKQKSTQKMVSDN